MTVMGNAVITGQSAAVQQQQQSSQSSSEKEEVDYEVDEIANNNGSRSVQCEGEGGGNVSCSANISLVIKSGCLREPTTTRKRTLPNNSSQLTTTEEDDEEEAAAAVAVAPTLDQDEGLSVCKRPRLEEVNQERTSSDIWEESQERPKNLMLLNVMRGVDSGFSSYSSGQESIPSPVDNSSSSICGGGSQSVAESSQGMGSEELRLSPQLTYSLSRDFNAVDKGSFSDSETYRRSSTKCVVNKGEANAIMKRLQGDLLFELGKSSGGGSEGGVAVIGREHEEEGEVVEDVAKREEEKGKGDGKGESTTLRATKSLMAEYEVRKEEDRVNNLCIICVTEPKDSAFVHARSLHISCCYKCAIKVWNKNKCCPICNRKVKNVLKCYVH